MKKTKKISSKFSRPFVVSLVFVFVLIQLFATGFSFFTKAALAKVTYTITASAGSGGTINPIGAVSVDKDHDKTFSITPNNGYVVSDVLIDGGSVGRVNSYTFNNVTANHTIAASFDGGWNAPRNSPADNSVSGEDNAFSSNNQYAEFNNSSDWAD